MLRVITAIIIVANCTNSLAQSKLDSDLTELERLIFISVDQQERELLRQEKILLYIDYAEFGEDVKREMSFVNSQFLDSLQREKFFWNASLHQHISLNETEANYYMNKYFQEKSSPDTQAWLLRYLTKVSIDSSASRLALNELISRDSLFSGLECLCELAYKKPMNSGPYILTSALIPGSGMMAAGYPLRGLTSLGIHGGIALFVAAMIQWNTYLNAVSWGLTLVQKFYVGNIRLTNKLVGRRSALKKEKLATRCELFIDTILQKYPLDYLR